MKNIKILALLVILCLLSVGSTPLVDEPVTTLAETASPAADEPATEETTEPISHHIAVDDNDTELITWAKNIHPDMASHIFEHDGDIYRVSETGDIYIKRDGSVTWDLFHRSDLGEIQHILIDNSWLYYSSWLDYNVSPESAICRIHLENGLHEIIVETQEVIHFYVHEPSGYILDTILGFSLYNGIIYINAPPMMRYGYNMESDELFVLQNDVSNGVFSNNKFYYIDHGNRTFSIYSLDLESGEIKLLRGDGITWEFGERSGRAQYYECAAIGGKLLYRGQGPSGFGIYLYKEDGNDVLLALLDHGIDSFGTDRRYIYWRYADNVYRYDPSDDSVTVV